MQPKSPSNPYFKPVWKTYCEQPSQADRNTREISLNVLLGNQMAALILHMQTK